ncbi:hypothetical protein F2Q68_00015085 [Brassica cretica]|uniref:Uncharacterized protein n=1 Tax=Brassica cretica TaxID=69181 RepID=A0A8S9HIT4_BRACR|nr:hypothetical protein F2Q68_00015085 [Brassica cretica]
MESSQTTSVDQHTPSVDRYPWLNTLPVCTITPRPIGRKFLSLSQFFKNTSETLGEVKTLYEEVILASTKGLQFASCLRT